MAEHTGAQLIWFDWWIEQDAFRPWLAKFAAWFYNRGVALNRPVAINYKFDAFPPGSAVYDVERGQTAGIRPMLWQNDTSVSVTSWGWIEGQKYKDIRDILGDLLDVVSKNGALLLNVGSKPDGSRGRRAGSAVPHQTGWRSTVRRSMAPRRSRSAGRARRRSRTRSSTMNTECPSPLRTSGSPPAPTSSTPRHSAGLVRP
jgi:alpha-L-fucosidase